MKNKGKQARSRATIGAILDAAAHVLTDYGYDRSTTNRIAEKAGYSVGTLYQYFDNKEDVYSELVEQEAGKLLAVFSEFPMRLTLRETLSEINLALYYVFRGDPVILRAVEILLSGRFRDKREQGREMIIKAMATILGKYQEEISVTDLDLASRVVVTATEGYGVGATAEFFVSKNFLTHMLRLQMSYLSSDWDT